VTSYSKISWPDTRRDECVFAFTSSIVDPIEKKAFIRQTRGLECKKQRSSFLFLQKKSPAKNRVSSQEGLRNGTSRTIFLHSRRRITNPFSIERRPRKRRADRSDIEPAFRNAHRQTQCRITFLFCRSSVAAKQTVQERACLYKRRIDTIGP